MYSLREGTSYRPFILEFTPESKVSSLDDCSVLTKAFAKGILAAANKAMKACGPFGSQKALAKVSNLSVRPSSGARTNDLDITMLGGIRANISPTSQVYLHFEDSIGTGRTMRFSWQDTSPASRNAALDKFFSAALPALKDDQEAFADYIKKGGNPD